MKRVSHFAWTYFCSFLPLGLSINFPKLVVHNIDIVLRTKYLIKLKWWIHCSSSSWFFRRWTAKLLIICLNLSCSIFFLQSKLTEFSGILKQQQNNNTSRAWNEGNYKQWAITKLLRNACCLYGKNRFIIEFIFVGLHWLFYRVITLLFEPEWSKLVKILVFVKFWTCNDFLVETVQSRIDPCRPSLNKLSVP